MNATDPFDLDRFVRAQAGSYAAALAELRRGRKTTHWMWFIFPQLAGLGRSATAAIYAIDGVAEARAYLAHPVLGERLRTCVATLETLPSTTPEAVFGTVDAVKLRSCLTLFEVASGERIFGAALERWFAGARDPATLAILD